MQPALFRQGRGFAVLGAATSTLLCATPALAAPFSAELVMSAAPLAIAAGALGFGLLAALLVRRSRREGSRAASRARQQLAGLRAELDRLDALLEGMPEVTVIWTGAGTAPRVYGLASEVLPAGHRSGTVLDFGSWLTPADARALVQHLSDLRVGGRSFDLTLMDLHGGVIRAAGRVLGGSAVLRLRAARARDASEAPPASTDLANARTILGSLEEPAWIRDPAGTLVYANNAYLTLSRRLVGSAPRGTIAEIFPQAVITRQLTDLKAVDDRLTLENVLEDAGPFDLVLFPIKGGTAGYLRHRTTPGIEKPAAEPAEAETGLGGISGVIDALSTPIAIFDHNRQLIQFNRAFCELWELDPDWLEAGRDEREILDRLRTQGQLPAEVDYRAWRAEHLKSYGLKAPREVPWYLPDGRTLNVISAPASAKGGVIYVFEDKTAQLKLESRYNALIHVQSETLNALSEGVAVFGTNGRLTLSNPRLSQMWALPMNELGKHPHIDQIAETCAKSMPEDGRIIWEELKRGIIDLNPNRTDKSSRIKRADGRLLDYAIVRLPDGQTMMTFVDVTESTNYQQVLKERNDALITADRLKDAFVQNVSYELRSPLTNIIGFADLLASGTAGELNEKQKSYTEYIRASSATLGVLIDNILDLATVDAGVAQLHLSEQDIPRLVEMARAGLAATFAPAAGEKPLNLTIEIADDLPVFVADGTRIVQILYNLLSNAARFSEPGAEVRLSVTSRAGRIVFAVEDEGAGISEEIKAALFQRFEGQSVEGRQRGAGLGLAIVKTFVNLHGGTVHIERREPKGTRVVVSIPANAAEQAGAAE